ncbi:hypothetical protein AO365_0768 [Moraxella catarrhalis]|nr:hypothetical protein AO365_0768 [Moraxella catarrhalis]
MFWRIHNPLKILTLRGFYWLDFLPIFIKYADHTVHKASVYLGTILF